MAQHHRQTDHSDTWMDGWMDVCVCVCACVQVSFGSSPETYGKGDGDGDGGVRMRDLFPNLQGHPVSRPADSQGGDGDLRACPYFTAQVTRVGPSLSLSLSLSLSVGESPFFRG